MKKKIVLIVALVTIFVVSATISLINWHNKNERENQLKKQKGYEEIKENQIKNQKRYDEIKKDIDKEMQDYIYIIAPNCEKGSSGFLITHQELVYNRGMSKEQFLDVDEKSYCKAYVPQKCVEDGVWNWDVYISCKDYQDEEYQDWRKGFEAE